MNQSHNDKPWVIIQLKNSFFGLSSEFVQSMVPLEEITSVPMMPKFVKGVFNLRGSVVPVIELRTRLNMPSLDDEIRAFASLMEQRENDHRKWLTELEASVTESREFKLATDPHKCAFGKWYDQYVSDDFTVSMLLKRFDEPHKKIHGIASEVRKLIQDKNVEAARKLIESTRNTTLNEMIKLFREVAVVYKDANKGIAVVLESKKKVALQVDKVISVEYLADEPLESLNEITDQVDLQFSLGIGKRKQDKALVHLLNAEAFLNE
jgi:chemotaxis signal transduction protein